MKKISILVLILVLAVSTAFCGCGGKPIEPTPTPEEVFTPIKVVSNGVDLSSYKIVVCDDAVAVVNYAADELKKYIKAVTGTEVEVIRESVAATDNEIVIGKTNRDTVDYDALGSEGYHLYTKGNKLFLASNNTRGSLYAVYSFLEVMGYRFYAVNAESLPDDVFVPKKLDYKLVPKVEYREIMYENAWNADLSAKRNINSSFQRDALDGNAKYGGAIGYAGGGAGLVHTFSHLLPKTLLTTNPEYFALFNDVRTSNQPCFTNFDSIDTVFANIENWIAIYPTQKMVSVSQNDNDEFCECDNCVESYRVHGESGTMLNYINKIAAKMATKYPDYTIDTLAYGRTTALPKSNVVPASNVAIRLCLQMHPKFVDYTPEGGEGGGSGSDTVYETILTQEKRIADWDKISDNLYMWYYVANYLDYFSLFPNFQAMHRAINIFSKHDVKGIYAEGYGSQSGEFGELRIYILSKMLMNPSMSFSEYKYHFNDFINGYYGEGGKYIAEFIWAVEKDAQESKSNMTVVSDPISYLPIPFDFATETWDISKIEKYQGMFDKAMELATPEQQSRLEKSRISLTYYELYYTMTERYKKLNSDGKLELKDRNEALYKTMKKYNVMRKQGSKYISDNVTIFERSPKYW